MELILEDDSTSAKSMKIAIKSCWIFLVTMFSLSNIGACSNVCFYLEYHYLPYDYKIIMECERGFIVIEVQNKAGDVF